MSASEFYAIGLALLGVWGLFTVRRPVKLSGSWSKQRRWIVLVDAFFVMSCLGCAAALWTGQFRAWMGASIGVSYLLMLPMPCYFARVNRVRWLHVARNLLFVAVAAFFLALAVGAVPLTLLGLR
jgi:hypothetical protein